MSNFALKLGTAGSLAPPPSSQHQHHHQHSHHHNHHHSKQITVSSRSPNSPPPTVSNLQLSRPSRPSSSISVGSPAVVVATTTTTTKSVVVVPRPTMAVTSTVPPGARSTSPPCSVGPYGQPQQQQQQQQPNVNQQSSSGGGGSQSGGGPPQSVPPPPPPTSGNNGNSNGGRCCETGRTIFTDPVTGQTLCSCQYDLLNYPRLAAAGGIVATGPGGVPLGVYPEGMAAYLSGMGGDQPPFYPNPSGLDLKDSLVGSGAPWPYPSVYHSYDAAFGGYPFNSYGMDLNGARRKNATRETTSTLKAWLNEHKKNPYPTKGEKIMLAIITKMTLTQVSTWFANARRRLKKENKMTWEPRNRVDDDDANLDDDDHKSNDDKDMLDAKDSGIGSTEDGDRPSNRLDLLDRPEGNSEWSGSRPGSANGSPDLYDHHPHLHHHHHHRPPGVGHPLLHPAALHHHFRPPAGSPPDISNHHHHHHLHHAHHTMGGNGGGGAGGIGPGGMGSLTTGNTSSISKPRIWSLADMASKETKDSNNRSNDDIPPPSSLYSHPQHASPGKILSPLAARITNYPPYGRPDLYRGFYGPAAAHLGGPTSAEFLDHHQRQFQASLAAHHNQLSMNPLLWKAAVTGAGPPFAPLSLTTNNHHTAPPAGASPSASSTSSSMGAEPISVGGSSSSGGGSRGNGGNHSGLGGDGNLSSILPSSHAHQQLSGNSSSSSSSGKLSPGICSNASVGSKP